MIPTVKSGHPCSREYIMDRDGGRKFLLCTLLHGLLQEKHEGGQSVCISGDEIENIYFLTDPHVFLKIRRLGFQQLQGS